MIRVVHHKSGECMKVASLERVCHAPCLTGVQRKVLEERLVCIIDERLEFSRTSMETTDDISVHLGIALFRRAPSHRFHAPEFT